MSVRCRHLLHDVDDFHRWIPSREVGIRGELECVVDGFIEYFVACSLDVLVREPVFLSRKKLASIDACVARSRAGTGTYFGLPLASSSGLPDESRMGILAP